MNEVVVIGAGAGGLAAAIRLAAAGYSVTVLEKEAEPGGKMRQVDVEGAGVDAGPTVLTMRWVFEALLAEAGVALDSIIATEKAGLLERHFWRDGSRLDLFADVDRSADAVRAFSDGANVDGYRRFCRDSAEIFRILKPRYIAAQRPSFFELVGRLGIFDMQKHLRLRPFSTLWQALGDYFTDPRLRQLFARYATYCGSSPFLAPATLMLVAHVEQDGVWIVDGGMSALAKAMAGVAEGLGVIMEYGANVTRIDADGEGVTGVWLGDGRHIAASAVVFNGDVSALAGGLLGELDTGLERVLPADRSLSALAWTLLGDPGDFPLAHHTVFFSECYSDEFDAIFKRGELPRQPTVYICAQDRDGEGRLRSEEQRGNERMLVLVNAPANGDHNPMDESEAGKCLSDMKAQLAACGLRPDWGKMRMKLTGPDSFERLFPGSGGAIYGQASHGWMSAFQRAGSRTRVPGLYLAGGSVHPGPGVPMATLSGCLAAESLVADRVSMQRFRPAATFGGMRTG